MRFVLFFSILLALLFCSLSNKAEAQVNFYYGPRIGLAFSTFIGKDANNVNYPLGTIIGVYTQTKLSDRISIDAELTYISVGSTFSTDKNTPEEKDYKIALGYLTIPINVNYRLYKGLNIQAGVQTGYLFTAVTEQKFQGSITKDKTQDGYNRFDVCPMIGVFYQFEKGLQCGIRYYAGIQSVYEEHYDMHNIGLQFLLAYRFNAKNP